MWPVYERYLSNAPGKRSPQDHHRIPLKNKENAGARGRPKCKFPLTSAEELPQWYWQTHYCRRYHKRRKRRERHLVSTLYRPKSRRSLPRGPSIFLHKILVCECCFGFINICADVIKNDEELYVLEKSRFQSARIWKWNWIYKNSRRTFICNCWNSVKTVAVEDI